jgi:hypothetical protein
MKNIYSKVAELKLVGIFIGLFLLLSFSSTSQAGKNCEPCDITVGCLGLSCPICTAGLDSLMEKIPGVACMQRNYTDSNYCLKMNENVSSDSMLPAINKVVQGKSGYTHFCSEVRSIKVKLDNKTATNETAGIMNAPLFKTVTNPKESKKSVMEYKQVPLSDEEWQAVQARYGKEYNGPLRVFYKGKTFVGGVEILQN